MMRTMHRLLLLLLLLLQVSLLAAQPALRHPDPASVQFIPAADGASFSIPATIPAFPEQSDFSAAACPLDPPANLLPYVAAACAAPDGAGPPSRSRCCPALHAWLLSAYSATALASRPLPSAGFDLPALPDDSESCIGGVERALRRRGVELPRVNATCDAAYCYCGVRLRRLACPGAFVADAREGRWVPAGDAGRRLQKDCSRPGFPGCTRCLRTLNQLKAKKKQLGGSSSNLTAAAAAHHNRECQLMGVTWLLSKNRTLFLPSAASVLQALMAAEHVAAGPDPPATCSLSLADMPLAVGSDQINGNAAAAAAQPSSSSLLLLLLLLTLVLSALFYAVD